MRKKNIRGDSCCAPCGCGDLCRQPGLCTRRRNLGFRKGSLDESLYGRVCVVEGKPEQRQQALSWETGAGKSYLVPALEIPAFLLLLNGYDRLAYPNSVEPDGKKTYGSTLSTFWDHVSRGPWGVDTDAFDVNQFMHPYQGSMYYGFARSAGLSFWESFLYANVGSFLWETGGETTHPSSNDQIASGIGGSLFGEALFRMAGLVLEGDEDGGKPGFWRELGAAIISPPTGFNRLAFGDRFKPVYPSHNPANFWRLRLGASLTSTLSNDQGGSNTIDRKEASVDFSMAYGLPGKPGYSYTLLGDSKFGAVEWRGADSR